MEEDGSGEGTSLALTPTWAVATVVTVMVTLGWFFQGSLKQFGKWLDKTKRKALLSALDKIKEELMLFGLLSLLMGHWIVFVAKICIRSSALSSRFYPCAVKEPLNSTADVLISSPNYMNKTLVREQMYTKQNQYCPEGRESFASYESLEQLHRLLFVLGITHVSYSFVAIALAMLKIYSWRTWESHAKTMAVQSLQDSPKTASYHRRMRRLSTFIFHRTSHPWSQHRVLVWLLCFSRQFWSSISQSDYMALRFGFITKHQLPLTYDFHSYMVRSMEEEFRDIVGISVPLWIYAICCIFLDFHGTDVYFWLSFLPAILAVEIMDGTPRSGNHKFHLRDELFWFRKPRLLLRLIQLISFQNAFEMATFLWSLWEIKHYSCFMDNQSFVVIRLIFGVVTQIWCSFITFPLYVIITQMGSRFKRTLLSENVRNSLHGWQRRVKARQSHGSSAPLLSERSTTTSFSDSAFDSIGMQRANDAASSSAEGSVQKVTDAPTFSPVAFSASLDIVGGTPDSNVVEIFEVPFSAGSGFDHLSDEENEQDNDQAH